MTGKRLAKRIGITFTLTAGLFIFLTAIDADATPIRPDIKKLVSQPQQDAGADLGPARAGWDGPEMARTGPDVSPALDVYDSAAAPRAWRQSFLAAATPDPSAVLGIMATIFLLRLLRSRDRQRRAATVSHEESPERMAA